MLNRPWTRPPAMAMPDLPQCASPVGGGTNRVMRAKAVAPTRTALTIANASRQTSEGTPISANPSDA